MRVRSQWSVTGCFQNNAIVMLWSLVCWCLCCYPDIWCVFLPILLPNRLMQLWAVLPIQDQLCSISDQGYQLNWETINEFPWKITLRHRGKCGGLWNRIRARRSDPPLPTIVFGNVRSLINKMDELRASTRYLREYHGSCLMCFSKTWLNENIPDSAIDFPNFNAVRGDRSLDSGKSQGRGVCIYVNRCWCNN